MFHKNGPWTVLAQQSGLRTAIRRRPCCGRDELLVVLNPSPNLGALQKVARGRDESKSRPYAREGLPEPVERRFYRNKSKVHSHGILPRGQDVKLVIGRPKRRNEQTRQTCLPTPALSLHPRMRNRSLTVWPVKSAHSHHSLTSTSADDS